MYRPKFFIWSIIVYIFFTIPSCDYYEELKYVCILNCNPAECLILDEEKCECVRDPDCISERLCGGNINDCGCDEEDGGVWCSALTGDSLKTWVLASIYDSLTEEIISAKGHAQYTYRLDQILIQYVPDFEYLSITSWKFDNVVYPGRIVYRCPTVFYFNSSYYPESDYYDEKELIKLTADTLILTDVEGSITSIYIPDIPEDID